MGPKSRPRGIQKLLESSIEILMNFEMFRGRPGGLAIRWGGGKSVDPGPPIPLVTEGASSSKVET